jgi:SAM-dependent methyltransferase
MWPRRRDFDPKTWQRPSLSLTLSLSPRQPTIGSSFLGWFREQVERRGFIMAAVEFAGLMWQFIGDSTPARRRQRYGDVDYDWDHRVDTTSATVSWHDRLLGIFNSPYQPTDPALFHEMMSTLNIDFRQFVFVDIGSGKGRALLIAADYPFRKIIGIELLPALHRVAEENIRKYKSDSQQCFEIAAVCGDACEFLFPSEPLVLYLFNPLPELGLVRLLGNLEHTLKENPMPVYVLYHNPLWKGILGAHKWLHKTACNHQYSIFAADVGQKAVEQVE